MVSLTSIFYKTEFNPKFHGYSSEQWRDFGSIYGFKVDLDLDDFPSLNSLEACLHDVTVAHKLPTPAFIVQTSPQRFHVVYLFKNPLKSSSKLKSFSSVARPFHIALNGDPNSTLLSQLDFKLPGSINPKNKFMIRCLWLIHKKEELPTHHELFEAIHGYKPSCPSSKLPLNVPYDELFNYRRLAKEKEGGPDENIPSLYYYDDIDLIEESHKSQEALGSPKEEYQDKIKPPYQKELPERLLSLSTHHKWEAFLRHLIPVPHLDEHGGIAQPDLAKKIGLEPTQIGRFLRILTRAGQIKCVNKRYSAEAGIAMKWKAFKDLLECHKRYYSSGLSRKEGAIKHLRTHHPLTKGHSWGEEKHWFNLLYGEVGLNFIETLDVVMENSTAAASVSVYEARFKSLKKGLDRKRGEAANKKPKTSGF